MQRDSFSGSHSAEGHLFAGLVSKQINIDGIDFKACKAIRKSAFIKNMLKRQERGCRDIRVEFPLGGKDG